MTYLTRNDLISINHSQIELFGGRMVVENENVLNNNSLEYLLEIVQQDYYSSVYKKAAAYIFLIIKDHIFQDGCKRTGMLAGILFLRANSFNVMITDDQIKEWPLKVENNELKIDDLALLLETIPSS